jgi:predicted PurR-regulated permease PerM
VAQTVLAAAALIVAGVPGVVLLSSMTFLLALVQIGPLAIAVIAGGILLLQGGILAAALTIAWFLVVVMSVDNLIRPYFASQDGDTPAFLTFLGALGGLLAFGLIGVFIGPVLIALLYRLLAAWVEPPASGQS